MPKPRIALVVAALLLGAAAPTKPPPGTPVLLHAQPGTPAETTARTLAADDIAAAKARGDNPIVLIGTADLGGERPAIFVQLQSPRECGSAGCSVGVYAWERGSWKRVLDASSGRLTVSRKRTRGRSDLYADSEHFVWTGSAYRSTRPAPAIDLRPKTGQR